MNSYKPPILLRNGHLQTIYPSFFRKLDASFYERERIETPDKDFLDLDWVNTGSKRLVIISHGMEGSSKRPYVVGMARALSNAGWDVLAWNFRTCSGEINRKLRFYHSGTIDDLDTVINHARDKYKYDQVALVGFSMGGNQILVYLGTHGDKLKAKISRSIVFSVPCDLKSSAEKLAHWSNSLYMRRFLNFLHEKIKKKKELFPGLIDDSNYTEIKTFKQFDDQYTAPIHGFMHAEDYWEKCSSKHFLHTIKVPTIIVNAHNDPFLTEACMPYAETVNNNYVQLEDIEHGGHVGFVEFNKEKLFWSEKRAVEFLNQETKSEN